MRAVDALLSPVLPTTLPLGSGFKLVVGLGSGPLYALLMQNEELLAGPIEVPEDVRTYGLVLQALLRSISANMRFLHDGRAELVDMSDRTPKAIFLMATHFLAFEIDSEGDRVWTFVVPSSFPTLSLFDLVELPGAKFGRVGLVRKAEGHYLSGGDNRALAYSVVEEK